MVRPLPILALAALALCACHGPSGKGREEAASGAPAPAPPPAAAAPAPAPPTPTHNWAYREGDAYAYLSGTSPPGQPEQPTLIRFLGEQDGVYTIIESEGGAVVAASCAKPCDTVRLRGKGMDQTLPLSPNSIVYAALSDAMEGQLDVYKLRARRRPASGQ